MVGTTEFVGEQYASIISDAGSYSSVDADLALWASICLQLHGLLYFYKSQERIKSHSADIPQICQ